MKKDIDVVNASPSEDEPQTIIPSAQALSGARLFVVEFCLCFGLFLSMMDSSIVSTALISISYSFDNFVDVTWVVQAYLLSYMAFTVLFARVSDCIGRRNSLLVAWTIFTVFSLGCGLSKSLNTLIAFRVLQGVGGSGLYCMMMVILPDITPTKLLPLMSAMIGVCFASGAALGPILGMKCCQDHTTECLS